jgi:hypothetical protein
MLAYVFRIPGAFGSCSTRPERVEAARMFLLIVPQPVATYAGLPVMSQVTARV